MHTGSENVHRATIAIVGWIHRKLVVERDVQPLTHCNVIVGFDDLFRTIRQCAITHENAGAPLLMIVAVRLRDRVNDAGERKRVVGTVPRLTLRADAKRSCAVNIRERP